jgi:hypothetical protein
MRAGMRGSKLISRVQKLGPVNIRRGGKPGRVPLNSGLCPSQLDEARAVGREVSAALIDRPALGNSANGIGIAPAARGGRRLVS